MVVFSWMMNQTFTKDMVGNHQTSILNWLCRVPGRYSWDQEWCMITSYKKNNNFLRCDLLIFSLEVVHLPRSKDLHPHDWFFTWWMLNWTLPIFVHWKRDKGDFLFQHQESRRRTHPQSSPRWTLMIISYRWYTWWHFDIFDPTNETSYHGMIYTDCLFESALFFVFFLLNLHLKSFESSWVGWKPYDSFSHLPVLDSKIKHPQMGYNLIARMDLL